MSRQARRLAARWVWHTLTAEWQPSIPQEALAFADRNAYLPDTPELQTLDDARDSVGVFLPKILNLLKAKQGDQYYVNASESQSRIFYFFSPRQPIDAFNLTIAARGSKVLLAFGYTPYGLNGMLDLRGMLSEKAVSDSEVAGLAVMRLVRSLLSRIP